MNAIGDHAKCYIVNILGVDYSIGTMDDHSRDDGGMGRCDEKLAMIRVAESMPAHVKDATLLHEIVHAVSGMLQIGLSEKQVGALAAGLFSVRHNGERLMRGVFDGA